MIQYQARMILDNKICVAILNGGPQFDLASVNAGQLLAYRREAFSELSKFYPDLTVSDVRIVHSSWADFISWPDTPGVHEA